MNMHFCSFVIMYMFHNGIHYVSQSHGYTLLMNFLFCFNIHWNNDRIVAIYLHRLYVMFYSPARYLCMCSPSGFIKIGKIFYDAFHWRVVMNCCDLVLFDRIWLMNDFLKVLPISILPSQILVCLYVKFVSVEKNKMFITNCVY